ncbi:hypothetical protein HMPREF9445_00514 [Bacteroides clarus YIT 12056]|uniref:Uncharacterized protein n=1 Tax=Bacteroides clarus YIT 12056 TaxID=762984 RepID=A0ABP2KV32_9BACE|nr:hypothetical protein HMPREF9445_00514 [Bacteroides clarus YIT 12056]
MVYRVVRCQKPLKNALWRVMMREGADTGGRSVIFAWSVRRKGPSGLNDECFTINN